MIIYWTQVHHKQPNKYFISKEEVTRGWVGS